MLVSRRPVTLTLAAVVAVLLAGTACSSSDSGRDADAGSSASPSEGNEQRGGQAAPPEPEWDTSPSSVAAIGDSITRGFDACSLLSDCPEASWATGSDAEVASLARQLLGPDRLADRTWNLAKSGATVADLADQARRAAQHEPGLVTILIGANDACADDLQSMTSVADFEEAFREAVDVLRAESPDTQIYVASVPDLMRLWEEGSRSTIARVVWQLANICPSMLHDAGDTSPVAAERRESVRERVQAYNEVLAEVCASDRLCRYDGGAVFDFDFTTDHLSDWDWFHPGHKGQRQLAELAYEQVVADVTPAE